MACTFPAAVLGYSDIYGLFPISCGAVYPALQSAVPLRNAVVGISRKGKLHWIMITGLHDDGATLLFSDIVLLSSLYVTT